MTKEKPIRIGIIGCAGGGKSSLAISLSAKLGIPFIASRVITSDIVARDGYEYGSGVQIERFLAAGSRQLEIFLRTKDETGKNDSFVTDRTFIDLAAYAVCELQDDDPALLRKIYDGCRKEARVYTHLIFLPWKDGPVQDNHKRTLNPWYQFAIHSLDLSIMTEWELKPLVLHTDSISKRVEEFLAFMQSV